MKCLVHLLVFIFMLVCASADVIGAPTMSATPTYNQGLGVIEWEIEITQDASGPPMSVELPFILSPVDGANGFTVSVQGNGGDNTNGTAGNTWYYNETSAGSGTLVWNTQQNAGDEEQNLGNNPFTGTATEGLWIDPGNPQLFAALGSDINLPVPVATLHIASTDGDLSWTNALVSEGGPATSLTGSASSVLVGDMDGDGDYDRTDVNVMRDAINNFANYQATYPGLDGVGRGDVSSSSSLTSADLDLVAPDFDHDYMIAGGDLSVWQSAYGVNAGADGDGNGASDGNDFMLWQQQFGNTFVPSAALSAGAVPEPSSLVLLVAASLVVPMRFRLCFRRTD